MVRPVVIVLTMMSSVDCTVQESPGCLCESGDMDCILDALVSGTYSPCTLDRRLDVARHFFSTSVFEQ